MMTRRQSPLLLCLTFVLLRQQEVLSFVSQPQGLSLTPTKTSSLARPTTTVRMNGMWSQGSDLEGPDKLKACIPYILPILDGDHFGKYIYDRIPPVSLAHDVLLGGLVHIWEIFPFSGLILFVALTLGTRGNTEMDRNVRFSAQQAALIDVSLIVPELISSSFDGEDVPRQLLEPCSNFTYYYLVAVVLYCIALNLRGKKPDQIPYISGWSDMLVGPF